MDERVREAVLQTKDFINKIPEASSVFGYEWSKLTFSLLTLITYATTKPEMLALL